MIAAIDLESDFDFEAPYGDTVTARVDVILSIEGNTYKGDYLMDDGDDLQLVGELSHHYFETLTPIRARAVIEIDIEGGFRHFDGKEVVLEENPVPPHAKQPSSVELDFGLHAESSPERRPDTDEPGGQR